MARKRKVKSKEEESNLIDFESARRERRMARAESAQASRDEKEKQRERAVTKKKLRNPKRTAFYVGVICVVLAVLGDSIINLYVLEAEKKVVEAEKKALEEAEAKLQDELTKVDSLEYIEQEARSQLHMTKPGEKLYVLPEDDEETSDDENTQEEDAAQVKGIEVE